MSKRFGRNQKRRLTQELARYQHFNSTLMQTSGIQVSEISRLETRLRSAEAVLGVDNPAFPPSCSQWQRPTQFDPHTTVRMPNGAHANPMVMTLNEGAVLCHREQAHMVLAYGPHRWGYAITEQALLHYPREVLDQLNKLGARKC